VTIETAAGPKSVPFTLLPPEVQRKYWAQPVSAEPETATAPVADEELAVLANDVSLDTWAQVTAFGSFRDKPEKRGTGGLVTAKGFNAITENWVTVYSPKDAVGSAGNWDAQVAAAKAMLARNPQFVQQRWIEAFIKAGEAVARRDSNEFALLVRELKRSPVATEKLAEKNASKVAVTGLSTRTSDL
jgi:hypothetical protein